MALWDTSALLKLFLPEPDSQAFVNLLPRLSPPQAALIARFELKTAFLRREGEGALPKAGPMMQLEAL